MRKQIIRNLVILNCALLTLPGVASAAEDVSDSSDVYTLDEVIVSAVPLEKYLVTTSVITAADIEEKGAQNLSEALEDVPGVHMHRGKKNANTLDIRGSAIGYSKIYIDGVLVNPISKVSGDPIDLDMFPVENIAKIEVIKGPAPVSYGTDAIGGIVVITTKNGKSFQGGKVSLVGGSDDTLNATVSYGDGTDKFNYYVDAGTTHTDGFINNADRKSNYFNTKLNWKVKENASLTLTGGYSVTDKGALNPVDPNTHQPMYYTNGFWAGLNDWRFKDWKKTDVSLNYAEKANNKLDYSLKIYRFTDKQGLWAYGPNWRGSGSYSTYAITRWNASYWNSYLDGVDVQSNWKINDAHTLTFGAMYNDTDWEKSTDTSTGGLSNPYDYAWKKYNNKRRDFYLQDNFLPNEKTTVTFGIRHNKNEVTDLQDNASRDTSATNPTVNVVYQLDNRNTLRASYGETISFPTLDNLYGSSGDPNLKPEKAENYEVGLKHIFDERVTGDIAIFRNDIEDMIFRKSKSDIYKNVDYAKIRGVELELNKQFTDRYNGYINYTYLDTTGLDNGTEKDLKNTPNHNINYGVTYKADKGYKFSLTGHLVTERATWDSGSGDTRSVSGAVSTLPSYHLMDLQIKRQMNQDQSWYININNIFDKDYQDELFYPGEGVTVIVGLDSKF